jgi:hypothetical protein
LCALIAGCGGNSGNTTIINNNQTTVTTASGSTTTVAAPTTTSTAPDSATASKLPPEEPEEPEEPKSGPVACGDPGVVTGGSAATVDAPGRPGYANLEAEGMSCAVASSIAVAWANGFEVSSCGAGCVKEIGDVRCRYAGSGSDVGCYGKGQQQLTFAIVFPN